MLGFTLQVRSGQPVVFRLLVHNDGTEDLSFTFRSGQEVDFLVLKLEKPIWRWSAGQAFTMALHEKKVRRGQTLKSYEATWPGIDNFGNIVPTGHYQVKAYFLGISYSQPVAAGEFDLK